MTGVAVQTVWQLFESGPSGIYNAVCMTRGAAIFMCLRHRTIKSA